jgi:hypothetical protein
MIPDNKQRHPNKDNIFFCEPIISDDIFFWLRQRDVNRSRTYRHI